MQFKIESEFSPTGDQPQAISELVKGINSNEKYQTLLGVTGSGKTFTIANVIETANESGIYSGTYSYKFAADATVVFCRDTDGDGIPDYLDTDDDGDGLADCLDSDCANDPSCVTSGFSLIADDATVND